MTVDAPACRWPDRAACMHNRPRCMRARLGATPPGAVRFTEVGRLGPRRTPDAGPAIPSLRPPLGRSRGTTDRRQVLAHLPGGLVVSPCVFFLCSRSDFQARATRQKSSRPQRRAIVSDVHPTNRDERPARSRPLCASRAAHPLSRRLAPGCFRTTGLPAPVRASHPLWPVPGRADPARARRRGDAPGRVPPRRRPDLPPGPRAGTARLRLSRVQPLRNLSPPGPPARFGRLPID